MSFLLRHPKRTNKKISSGNQAAFSDERILPRPRSAPNQKPTYQQRNHHHQQQQQHHQQQQHTHYGFRTKPTMESGNQILLQRTSNPIQRHPFNMNSQMNGKVIPQVVQKTPQSKQKQNQTAGMISMEEVMEDLRVLEQQQRESQRRIASARVTRESRLQQNASLQSRLESMKYSNGELRAQIRQSREVLSVCTRSLGARRLANGRIGDGIRDFEKKLKKGLHSARMIMTCRRKIGITSLVLENKIETLQRMSSAAEDKLAGLEQTFKKAKQEEEALREEIRQEVNRTQIAAKETVTLRTENLELEQELVEAQKLEESTKLKVEALEVQINSEKKTYDDKVAELNAQLEESKKSLADVQSCDQDLKKSVSESDDKICKTKKHLLQSRNSEGQPYCVDDDAAGIPRLDTVRCDERIKALEKNIQAGLTEKSSVEESAEKAKAEASAAEEGAKQAQKKIESLSEQTRETLAREQERKKETSDLQGSLEAERREVEKLEKSLAEIQEARAQQTSHHNEKMKECDASISTVQAETDNVTKNVEAEDESFNQDTAAWNDEREKLNARTEAAKRITSESENALGEFKENALLRKNESETAFNEKLSQIDAQLQEAGGTDAKVLNLLENYANLNTISYEYDGNMSTEEQVRACLEPLIADCESQIKDETERCEAERNRRLEAQRQAEAAAAEVRRREEERIRIEQQREEERRLEEMQRKKEEERRIEEERQAERRRIEQVRQEELRKKEQQRREAEQRKIEKERHEALRRAEQARREEEERERKAAEKRKAEQRRQDERRRIERARLEEIRDNERELQAEEHLQLGGLSSDDEDEPWSDNTKHPKGSSVSDRKLGDIQSRRSDVSGADSSQRKRSLKSGEVASSNPASRDEPRPRRGSARATSSREASKTSNSQPSRRKRKGAEFYYPQTYDIFSEDETPPKPRCLLSNFVSSETTKPSTAAPCASQGTDKKVRWEDLSEDESKEVDDSSFESPSDDSDFEEEPLIEVQVPRRKRSYGSTQRGLSAIQKPTFSTRPSSFSSSKRREPSSSKTSAGAKQNVVPFESNKPEHKNSGSMVDSAFNPKYHKQVESTHKVDDLWNGKTSKNKMSMLDSTEPALDRRAAASSEKSNHLKSCSRQPQSNRTSGNSQAQGHVDMGMDGLGLDGSEQVAAGHRSAVKKRRTRVPDGTRESVSEEAQRKQEKRRDSGKLAAPSSGTRTSKGVERAKKTPSRSFEHSKEVEEQSGEAKKRKREQSKGSGKVGVPKLEQTKTRVGKERNTTPRQTNATEVPHSSQSRDSSSRKQSERMPKERRIEPKRSAGLEGRKQSKHEDSGKNNRVSSVTILTSKNKTESNSGRTTKKNSDKVVAVRSTSQAPQTGGSSIPSRSRARETKEVAAVSRKRTSSAAPRTSRLSGEGVSKSRRRRKPVISQKTTVSRYVTDDSCDFQF